MRDPEPKTPLPAREERMAELHMRRAWGEQLSETERAELAAAPAAELGAEPRASSPAGLEAVEAELRAAYSAARPASDLAAKVLAALPAAPQVARGAAGPDSLKVFVAPEVRYAGWRRVGLAAGLAAAVAAAAVGACFAYLAAAPPNVPPAKADVEVARGVLLDSSGRRAQALQPGQVYRVPARSEVLLKVRSDARVRVLADTEFELAGDARPGALRLREGNVYAAAGAQAAVIISPSFETEVSGVSLVLQEGPLPSTADGAAHGLILVFKGSARVLPPDEEEAVTLQEGTLYVSGFGGEAAQVFVAQAEERAREVEGFRGDPRAWQVRREQYVETVRGYEKDLAAFQAEIAAAAPADQEDLKQRRARVEALLAEHQRRLGVLPALRPGELPRQRARRIRRAAEQVREGREAYTDPNTWM